MRLFEIIHDPLIGYWLRRLTGYCNCGSWFARNCLAGLREEYEWAKGFLSD